MLAAHNTSALVQGGESWEREVMERKSAIREKEKSQGEMTILSEHALVAAPSTRPPFLLPTTLS